MQFQPRAHYSPEFRRYAAEHSLQSHETVAQFAAKLGIHPGLLTRWRRDFIMTQDPKPVPKTPSSGKTPQQLEREIARLEKKLQRAELENAILKKATEYFTKGQP